jgi:hypothetical protein
MWTGHVLIDSCPNNQYIKSDKVLNWQNIKIHLKTGKDGFWMKIRFYQQDEI